MIVPLLKLRLYLKDNVNFVDNLRNRALTARFASPLIIGLERYAGLATDFLNRPPVLCLLQYERHLLFAEPTFLHAKIFWLTNAKPNRDFSPKKWTNLSGAGHSLYLNMKGG
jgi:hypothetical protein